MGGSGIDAVRLALLAGLLAAAMAGGAAAQDAPAVEPPAFDNPALGTVPCIVLNGYDVAPTGEAGGGGAQYRASASVENICGRTLDVEFCFLTAAEEGDAGRSCYGAALRPGMRAEVNAPESAARVVGTDYRWKYRPQ